MMKKIWIVGIVLLAICKGTFAASFDCNKAATATEKAICSDTELSKLDETMGAVYTKVYSINPDIKSSQRDWIKGNRQCSESSNLVNCLKESYKNRLSGLTQLTDENRGWIGFEINGLVNTNQGTGVAVGKISPNSPAQASGLQTGDVVYQINGKPISDPKSIISAFSVPSGSSLNLKIISNGNSKELTIKAGIHPSTQPTQEQHVAQPELAIEPSAPTASESQSDLNIADSTDQVTTPEAAVPVEQTSALPEIPTNETSVEAESNGGSSPILTFILALILGGSIVFWVLRKKIDTSKVSTEPKLSPTELKQEPKENLSDIPVEKKSTEKIKVHHHVSEQVTQKPSRTVDTKVEEISEPDTVEKVNISMSQLKSLMKDEEEYPETHKKQTSTTASDLKFNLVIMNGNKRLYELPLSYESVANIVSSTPDNKSNDDLFELASHHPSTAVRESVTSKENLSESTISSLADDLSINVLRNLVHTNGFKEFANESILARIISRDTEAAQTIARNAGYFDQVKPKAIAKLIHDKGDPSLIDNLDEEFR